MHIHLIFLTLAFPDTFLSFIALLLVSLSVTLMIAGSVTWRWIGSGGAVWFCPPALGSEG